MRCRDAEGMVGELSLDIRGGSKRQRYSDERVLSNALTLMSLSRYCG